MFVLAQSMAIAMHLIGFCESLLDMLIQVGKHICLFLSIVVTFIVNLPTRMMEAEKVLCVRERMSERFVFCVTTDVYLFLEFRRQR
jgi:hypothetical protein